MSEFEQLITTMMRMVQVAGNEAEEYYAANLQSTPASVVNHLLEAIANATEPSRRTFCVILLSNIFRSNVLLSIPETDAEIQGRLMELVSTGIFGNEHIAIVSNLMIKAFTFYSSNTRLSEAFQARVGELCSSANNVVASVCLDVLAHGVSVGSFIANIDEIYKASVASGDFRRTMSMFRALYATFEKQQSGECFKHFAESFPTFLMTCPRDLVNFALSDAIEFIPRHPQFVNPLLLTSLVGIFGDRDRAKGTRELCLELVIEICEGFADHVKECAMPLMGAMVTVMCEIAEDEDVADEHYEDATPRTMTEDGVGRMVVAFKEVEGIPDAMVRMASDLLNVKEGVRRRCGLVVLRRVVQTFYGHFALIIGDVVGRVFEGIKDAWLPCSMAAFQVLSALSKTHEPEFQEVYHTTVIPLIVQSVSLRPTYIALKSLMVFLKSCQYLEVDETVLVMKLAVALLGASEIETRCKVCAIKCVGTLIDASGDAMEMLCQRVVPILFGVIGAGGLTLALPAMAVYAEIVLRFPTPEFAGHTVTVLGALAGIDQSALGHREACDFNNAVRAFASAAVDPGPIVPLVRVVIEGLHREITPRIVNGSIDRSNYTDEVIVFDEAARETKIFEKFELEDAVALYTTLSVFFMSEMASVLQMFIGEIVSIIADGISFWCYGDIQKAALICFDELILVCMSQELKDYSGLLAICNAFMAGFTRTTDIEVLCEGFGSAQRLCVAIARSGAAADAFLPCIVSLVKRGVQANSSQCTIASANLLSSCFQMSGNGSIFDDTFRVAFGDEVPVAKIIVWTSWIRFCNIEMDARPLVEFIRHHREAMIGLVHLVRSEKTAPLSDIFAGVALELLRDLSDEVRDPSDKNAVHNAILALALLFTKSETLRSNQDAVGVWLARLPISGKLGVDHVAVYDVFGGFLSHPALMSLTTLPHLLTVIAKALVSSSLSDVTRALLEGFLKQVSPVDGFEDMLQQISMKCQDILHDYIE